MHRETCSLHPKARLGAGCTGAGEAAVSGMGIEMRGTAGAEAESDPAAEAVAAGTEEGRNAAGIGAVPAGAGAAAGTRKGAEVGGMGAGVAVARATVGGGRGRQAMGMDAVTLIGAGAEGGKGAGTGINGAVSAEAGVGSM